MSLKYIAEILDEYFKETIESQKKQSENISNVIAERWTQAKLQIWKAQLPLL